MTTDAAATDAATAFVLLESSISTWKQPSAPLLNASDLYRIGTFLHAIKHASLQSQLPLISNVRSALDALLQSLPEQYRQTLFFSLKRALLDVIAVNQAENGRENDIVVVLTPEQSQALLSVAELYQSCAVIAAESTSWSLPDIALLRHVYRRASPTTAAAAVFVILSNWLCTKHDVEWDNWLPAIHLLQEDEKKQTSSKSPSHAPPLMLWNDFCDYKNDRSPGWKSALLSRYPEHYDYLLGLLNNDSPTSLTNEMATELRQAMQGTTHPADTTTITTPTVNAQTELQRRVDQVCAVLPDLGPGFVEICLSYYKGNVEQTIAALLTSNEAETGGLPTALRHLDWSLPAPRRLGATTLADDPEAEAARQIAKTTLLAVQRQEEQEAYLLDVAMRQDAHDLYNDDYDDQYDDTEGVGAADVGLYDAVEAVHTYNRAMKQVVAEDQFWRDNQNTNRTASRRQQQLASVQTNPDRLFRGPDKMRGGRVPQAGRSGGRSGGGGGGGGPGRGRGHGSGGGGGVKGRGGGRGQTATGDAKNVKDNDNSNNATTTGSDATDAGGGGNKQGKTRAKQRQMANRRDRQKKAEAKRSG